LEAQSNRTHSSLLVRRFCRLLPPPTHTPQDNAHLHINDHIRAHRKAPSVFYHLTNYSLQMYTHLCLHTAYTIIFRYVTPCSLVEVYRLFGGKLPPPKCGQISTRIHGVTEKADLALTVYNCIRAELGSTPANLTEFFRGFPQSLHENRGTVPHLCYDRVLPHPCQFIVHLSSYATWSRYWQRR
jgi:hypothetical protein